MPPAYFWYVKAFVTKHMVLYSSSVPITRLARKCQIEERMPPAYFQYVKAFVTKHMVLYSSDWYYLPGKNGHTIGITIRDTMKHTITRPQPAFR